jgi:hypothetical protein
LSSKKKGPITPWDDTEHHTVTLSLCSGFYVTHSDFEETNICSFVYLQRHLAESVLRQTSTNCQ